jgi:hypothetical protein
VLLRPIETTSNWKFFDIDIFSQYSLASLLSKNNIPHLSSLHEITIHLITTKSDYQRLKNKKSFNSIKNLDVKVRFSFIEDITGSEKPATGYTVKKYQFLDRHKLLIYI